jgi:murein DD-endopeptidase MepM/ murein hydrolase activator NlpD
VAEPRASGGTYTVISGDTLYSISRRHGTNPETIIALNDLGGQSQIKAGQVLKLPGQAAAAQTTAVAAGPPKPAPAPVQLASNGPFPNITMPQAAPAAKSPPVPAVASGAQIPATQASLTPPRATVDDEGPSANGTSFRWPVRGRIIAGFGSSPGGQRNDGINLAVPEGTSVKAAEAGTVIYAGNELEGYGNLILVRHADGWVTAYAHNKELAVKRGDTVTRGQIIGRAGMTGSVSAPQVHFELRQGSKPVNPLDHLSG